MFYNTDNKNNNNKKKLVGFLIKIQATDVIFMFCVH